jgi:hypothetical protein
VFAKKHGLEQSSISQRLNQSVAASLVLVDLDTAAMSDALSVDEIERIIRTDVDLKPGLARVSR